MNEQNKILCIQISNTLINDTDLSKIDNLYYDKLYINRSNSGYFKGLHFWECPQWITEINYNVKTDFYICTDIEKTVNYITEHKYKYVCFSVLDVNKHYIKDIINKCNEYKVDFIIGGYIKLQEYFKHHDNIHIFESIKEFIGFMGLRYRKGFDYGLFKGLKCIPRLTLSTGCYNNCAFCTVEKTLLETNHDIIINQVKAFKTLKFKLVYINDKTFGQCKNYKCLVSLYKIIKEYNNEFEGYIIQTTTKQLLKTDDWFLNKSHIKFIELGVETFNDNILKKYSKPSTESSTLKAFNKVVYNNKLNNNNINIIPNIIIGIPEENNYTYTKTLNFLIDNRNVISHMNIYNLAVYDNTPLSKQLKHNDMDKNENSVTKSFHKDKHIHERFFNRIFKLGINILDDKQLGDTMTSKTTTPTQEEGKMTPSIITVSIDKPGTVENTVLKNVTQGSKPGDLSKIPPVNDTPRVKGERSKALPIKNPRVMYFVANIFNAPETKHRDALIKHYLGGVKWDVLEDLFKDKSIRQDSTTYLKRGFGLDAGQLAGLVKVARKVLKKLNGPNKPSKTVKVSVRQPKKRIPFMSNGMIKQVNKDNTTSEYSTKHYRIEGNVVKKITGNTAIVDKKSKKEVQQLENQTYLNEISKIRMELKKLEERVTKDFKGVN